MSEKGFVKEREKSERKENRTVKLGGSLLFYAGVFVIISGLIYMLINLEKSDTIFHIWLPYIITGIAMVCVSLLLKMPMKGPRRYNR
jgi:uncharacterized membrane protein